MTAMKFNVAQYLVSSCVAVFMVASDECPTMPQYQCNCTNEGPSLVLHCDGTIQDSIPNDLVEARVVYIQNCNIEILHAINNTRFESLYLDHNNIYIVRDAAFSKLSMLKTLNLENNKITELEKETFAGLGELDILYMKNNPLYVIESYTFHGDYLPKLQILRLEYTNLFQIRQNAFYKLSELSSLNVSHNSLTHVPMFSADDDLKQLSILDISYNRLHRISGLHNLPALQIIRASYNNITRIYSDDFASFKNSIVSIDLRGNKLKIIEPVSFISLTKLASIDLSYNSLRNVYWEEMPWDSLAKLAVHDNPWECNCNNSMMRDTDIVKSYNKPFNTSCSAPTEVAGKDVFEIDDSYFYCPNLVHHKVKTGLIYGLAIVVLIGVVVIGVLLFRNKRKAVGKRGPTNNNGIPTYTRMNDGHGEIEIRA